MVYLESWNPLPMELLETLMRSSSLKRLVKSIGWPGSKPSTAVSLNSCRCRSEIIDKQKYYYCKMASTSSNYQDKYSV